MSKPDPPKSTEELLAVRRTKLDRLRNEFGIDPYGHRVDGLTSLADARAAFDADADQRFKDDPDAGDARPVVKIAGRVMQHRVMGNLVFMSLRDATGDLQIAVSKKAVGPEPFKIASKLTDLADLVVAEGALGTTKTGEVTVWAGAGPSAPAPEAEPPFTLITKSLALPPGKFHGLQDAEQRYRKRYVDLHANPEVMTTMRQRIAIIDAIRDYLRERGFAEVETPMLQTLHGGAAARPFHTHHNALDLPLTLRIAPELYLKRLLVGGMPKVFEINRNFRNEGISPRHNPEFTMLEAYEAYGSWETMADLVEDMVCTVAEKVFGSLQITHPGVAASAGTSEAGDAETPGRRDAEKTIDLTRPWRRVSMVDLVAERTGWHFDKQPAPETEIKRLRGQNPGKDLSFAGSPAEQLVEVYEKLIEPTLIDPCFVTHVPSVIIPLAKKNADDPYFADVYELAINGVEISPGYSELNDPQVQEANFRAQVGDEAERQQIDEDFLEALRVGMPPAGGMGLGIDRLVMMLTGAASIRDVILFPLMRPEQGQEPRMDTDGHR
jgi:lysyl-tRNA synthetase class 2